MTTTNSTSTREIFETIKTKSDRFVGTALAIYFLFGIFLAFFYDTYTIAFGVGGLCLLAYFGSKALLPGSTFYQYVLAAVLAIFSAQFIYQMHGLFEMHFFVFVGSTLLITYQKWKLQLPLIILVVIHHAAFAWLQYQGNKEIYFTQLDYMDLQTFMFHGGLAAVIVAICGYWSYDLEKRTISEFNNKKALETQLSSVKTNIAFAEDISVGKFDTVIGQDAADELGIALVKMRDNLQKASIKEHEERFITSGIAEIGEVIRKNSASTEGLADDFVRTIVKYLQINQAGLFLLEGSDEDQHLRLVACYAYERKKYLNKVVGIGEGLVGQCYQEREAIYITKLPDDYVRITSGLGGATPSCLYIVPLKTNDEIVGVLELASFTPLEHYKKEFIEKSAENIASSIISTKVTEKIKHLLDESQMQTTQMRAQEEEMRQNMEELLATQEEMARRNREMEQAMRTVEEQAEAKLLELKHQLKLERERAQNHESELMGRINALQAQAHVNTIRSN